MFSFKYVIVCIIDRFAGSVRTMKEVVLKLLLSLVLLTPFSSGAATKSCSIRYNLTGWSFFYKAYKGSGTVHCTNGQSRRVSLTLHGGGLTLGVGEIQKGIGKFSGIKNLQDIYGTYFTVDVHAGFARSAEARALVKGYIAGGGVGTGGGYNLGFALSGLTIRP